MFTKKCYRTIESQMGFGSMFNASLEASCNNHEVIIQEVAQSILDWAVPIGQAKPVLIGLGYTAAQVSDGIRYLRETDPTKVEADAEFSEIDLEARVCDLAAAWNC